VHLVGKKPSKQAKRRAWSCGPRMKGLLSIVVHKKAMEGDNTAGHLDLKIRERRASMHGRCTST
jgi:hypothetical protein